MQTISVENVIIWMYQRITDNLYHCNRKREEYKMTILDYYATTTMKSWILGFIIFFTTLVTIIIIAKIIKSVLDKRAARKYYNKIMHIAQENPIKIKKS